MTQKQVNKNSRWMQSLRHAVDGLVFAFKTERNIRIDCLMAFLAIGAGILFRIKLTEWLFICLAITGVFVCEMINTIIENLVDVISEKEYYKWAKHVKDMAAGMVVVVAIFALVIACMIFIPYIIK